jgi:hypothetical protein
MTSQAGNQNVVAISGTAFTQEHINIIKRFAEKVVLALDSDNAGFMAMLKSAKIALENDLEVLGLEIKDGKDPADMILKDPQMWRNTIFNEKSIFVILTKIILEKFDSKITKIDFSLKIVFLHICGSFSIMSAGSFPSFISSPKTSKSFSSAIFADFSIAIKPALSESSAKTTFSANLFMIFICS